MVYESFLIILSSSPILTIVFCFCFILRCLVAGLASGSVLAIAVDFPGRL